MNTRLKGAVFHAYTGIRWLKCVDNGEDERIELCSHALLDVKERGEDAMKETTRRQAIRRGTVYWVRFGDTEGSEQGGCRPALVIQNDRGNIFSPTTLVLPVTSRRKSRLPTHFEFTDSFGKPQTICAEQVRAIDKSRIESPMFSLDESQLAGAQRAFEAAVSSLLGAHTVPEVQRGSIYACKLGHGAGSEEKGTCPVLVVQNDKGNLFSPTTIVLPLLKPRSKLLPTHAAVLVHGRLREAAAEQIRAIDKNRLQELVGRASAQEQGAVDKAMAIAIGGS